MCNLQFSIFFNGKLSEIVKIALKKDGKIFLFNDKVFIFWVGFSVVFWGLSVWLTYWGFSCFSGYHRIFRKPRAFSIILSFFWNPELS
jgi:hypothetical protein